MSKPNEPSIGTRLLYFPAGAELPGGHTPSPALVNVVGGAAPDYLGMTFTVFARDGTPRPRTGVINVATWSAAGSNPQTAHWDYVDLSA